MTLKSTNFKLLAYLDLHGVEIAYYIKPGSYRTVIGEYGDTPRNKELIRLNDDATSEANRNLLDLFTADIRSWCEDYFVAEDAASSNPDLSPAGIAKQLEPVKLKFNASFNDLATRCRNLQTLHINKVNAIEAATDAVPEGDKVLLFLQCQEIRNYLRTIAETERMQLLINSDDYQIVFAIQSAPSCLEILPEGLLKRGKHARTQRLHGKALIAMADENAMLSRINEWLNAIPKVLDFVTLSPSLWPLPPSVYDDAEPADGTAE